MIRGISKIKGLGVYENYTKPEGMKNFSVKNLIYGWNYSGKTTLSRLFHQLENKIQNPDLSGCSFIIETDSGSITETNFMRSDLIVRVFNSDFVKDNLNFTGHSFQPILLLGKESDDAQKKLDHCENLGKRTQGKVSAFEKEVDELESSLSTAKTAAAARIKETLGLVKAYTATHLNGDIKSLSTSADLQLLANSELNDHIKLALTPDSERPGTVNRLVATPSINLLHSEAMTRLAETPNLTSTIKHLEENPLIEKWIEVGLSLHSNNDKCEFCGGDLSKHRLAELNAHFSKDLDDYKSKVRRLYNRVETAKVSIQLPKDIEFNPQFLNKFKEAAFPLPKAIEAFNEAVDTLMVDIQRKIDAPFRMQEPTDLPDGLAETIIEAIDAINQIIDDNNIIASNFTKAKDDAIKLAKFHYVKEFIDEQEKGGCEAKIERLKYKIERLNRFGKIVRQEADNLRAIISQAQRGREEMNDRLDSMLGNGAVQIRVVPDGGFDRFQLIRKNGEVAKNLSDGERTAVAFAYFLTKLKELKAEQFKQTIIYIDDPISSLDSNHIFQVTAAIKEIFFSKSSEGAWTTNCKQFFLSTHNFQFFSLIRELEPKKSEKAALYFIRKINATQSMLSNMPTSLCKYSSEYHFLFETIYKFHKASDKSSHDLLMLLPNAVRRFTELYTYSRIPCSTDYSVDRRAEALFGPEPAKRILKMLHYFSHANDFERIVGNNELIFDMEHAINDLLSIIQTKDPLHWEALVQAVSD